MVPSSASIAKPRLEAFSDGVIVDQLLSWPVCACRFFVPGCCDGPELPGSFTHETPDHKPGRA
jgi:hypothetical protein